MITHFFAFLGVSAIVIVMPGQDTVLVIRNTLLGERRSGVFTAIGVSTGTLVWALAASAGLAALLRASEPAFLAVKLVGAAYLVYLGGQALARAVRGQGWKPVGEQPQRRMAERTAFRQGLLNNLGNPKMAVFFTGLLPQFTAGGEGSFLAMVLLGLVFCTLTLAWLTGYAVAVARAGDVLIRPRIRRTLDALTGAILVALGVRIATERS